MKEWQRWTFLTDYERQFGMKLLKCNSALPHAGKCGLPLLHVHTRAQLRNLALTASDT